MSITHYFSVPSEAVSIPETNEVWTYDSLLKITASRSEEAAYNTCVNYINNVLGVDFAFSYLQVDIDNMSTRAINDAWPDGIIEIEI